MPPVVTRGGMRTTGVPLDADLMTKVIEVKRMLGASAKAVAIRYMMLQGYEYLKLKENQQHEQSIRERIERERGAA